MSVNSIVNVIAGKIGEVLAQEAKILYGVEDQVQSLREQLIMMNNFVSDMEEQHDEGGDRLTRNVINEIRNIAYDAEDVIESYILKASPPNMIEAFFIRYIFFSSGFFNRHQLSSEIEAIKVRIVEITENVAEGAKRAQIKTPMTSPHNIEEHVVGLEEDINKLVEVLTADETQIKLMSIVGMNGSGKTTLARKLFNHKSVKKYFDSMVWVTISELWDTKKVLVEVLRSSGETLKKEETESVKAITEKLHRYFERKRSLIVLDDVSTRKALVEIFQALQPSTKDGRKIIITTQNKEVVDDFPDLKCFFHEPRRLTEDESWELFRKIVLLHNSLNISVFEALGKEMLKKCEGLPLAVVALAGILAKKITLEEWEKLNKAVSSRIMEQGPVMEMLALSYNDMPCELKPCFLYLATFPKDYDIPVGSLCRMWIAEGFITTDQLHDGETLEDVAKEYLGELIRRYVVQAADRNYIGDVKTIRIHDLVRDLCINKAKEQDFLVILSSNSSNSNEGVERLRRVAIHSKHRPLPAKSHHLRSLIVHFARGGMKPISYQFQTFMLLRVVWLWGGIPELPTEIGNLIHLRYLGFEFKFCHNLPTSIGNLRNLLTLEYRVRSHCVGEVIGIPIALWKLSSLRHLYLPSYPVSGKYCGLKLHTLKHLQILKCAGGGSWMVEELPRLSPSVQKLEIRGIETEEQLEAAFQCPSICEDRLHSLTLSWESGVVLENEIEPIVHRRHLKKLWLEGRIQGGINIQFLTCVNKIVLGETGLKEEATLAGLGKLPKLTSLTLGWNSYKGTKWSCTVTEFPKLKQLKLEGLQQLEEWSIEGGALPALIKLYVGVCRKLRRVPQGLEFITSLQELQFERMNDELKERIRGGGEDAHLFQHVPRVIGV